MRAERGKGEYIALLFSQTFPFPHPLFPRVFQDSSKVLVSVALQLGEGANNVRSSGMHPSAISLGVLVLSHPHRRRECIPSFLERLAAR